MQGFTFEKKNKKIGVHVIVGIWDQHQHLGLI